MKTESSGIAGQGKPTTADVQKSLVNAANFKDFLLRNAQNMLAQTLPEYLSLQLKLKHLRRADVVRGSHLDRTNVKLELYVRDKRDAAILFAIQHGRSIDDANDLLDQLGVLPLGVPDE